MIPCGLYTISTHSGQVIGDHLFKEKRLCHGTIQGSTQADSNEIHDLCNNSQNNIYLRIFSVEGRSGPNTVQIFNPILDAFCFLY
mmetsp:Transcript_4229/g.6254  ORF Transcript_4229/g.6254 Transcript_4229/m.6254 type:complete len:85 (-) Transcript_4229:856-1110(-)